MNREKSKSRFELPAKFSQAIRDEVLVMSSSDTSEDIDGEGMGVTWGSPLGGPMGNLDGGGGSEAAAAREMK